MVAHAFAVEQLLLISWLKDVYFMRGSLVSQLSLEKVGLYGRATHLVLLANPFVADEHGARLSPTPRLQLCFSLNLLPQAIRVTKRWPMRTHCGASQLRVQSASSHAPLRSQHDAPFVRGPRANVAAFPDVRTRVWRQRVLPELPSAR